MSALEQAKQSISLPELMARLGRGEHAKKSARCPFHEDRNPSFGVYLNDKGEWAWKCQAGCGQGDGADFIAKIENISNSEACRRYVEIAGLTSGEIDAPRQAVTRSHRLPPQTSNESGFAYLLAEDECRTATRMAEALRNDPALCERIARSRKWSADTIRNLALEPSLGWDSERKCVAFLYETGVKLRTRKESGERLIWWAFGKPYLWRGGYLSRAQTVYLCEGETDAISIVDAGIEAAALSTLAVALPSATTFDHRWARLFSGKDVILALDADEAGQQATARISALLSPHVSHLRHLRWRD